MSSLSVTYVSHACLKIQSGGTGLLCDPWMLNEPIYSFTTWKFPAAVLSPEQVLEGITHVYISHTHEDHYHVPSLDLIPRDLELILPEYSHHSGLRAQTMERTMRELGFHRIRKILPWERLELSDDISVNHVPSAVSKRRDWENSGLVIEHPAGRLLNMNDNPSDDELCKEIDRRFGRFDLVFVQYAGVTTYPGRFRMSEEAMREAVANKRVNFNEQKRVVELLQSEKIVPFAGDFCWLDDRLLHCNWAARATPALFENWLTTNYPARRDSLMVMNPGDVWSSNAGLVRNHPPIDWDNYLDEIAALKRRFQPKIDAINTWLASSDTRDLKRRTCEYMGHIEKWVGSNDIDFSARFRILIEGPAAGFSFVISAQPDEGFKVTWDDDLQTDQTFHVPQAYWASLLEAKTMFALLAWAGEVEQHVPFRLDLAKFWFWIECYTDLGNRVPQAVVERIQHPWLKDPIRPRLGVFDQPATEQAMAAE